MAGHTITGPRVAATAGRGGGESKACSGTSSVSAPEVALSPSSKTTGKGTAREPFHNVRSSTRPPVNRKASQLGRGRSSIVAVTSEVRGERVDHVFGLIDTLPVSGKVAPPGRVRPALYWYGVCRSNRVKRKPKVSVAIATNDSMRASLYRSFPLCKLQRLYQWGGRRLAA
eukprot:scaffold30812_cov75-Phaeocystis_antarctica.AAC.3